MVCSIMPTHRISRLALVNAYLVEEEDGLTLIDTTITGGQKAILAEAEPPVPGEYGREIVRVLIACEESSASGREVLLR